MYDEKVNLTAINETKVKLTLLPNEHTIEMISALDVDIIDALNFSWEAVRFRDYDLILQVYFDNPIMLSQTVQNQDVF